MCNLNILIKKEKIKDKENLEIIPGFLMAVTSNSFTVNNDGDGVYFNNLLIRSSNKIDLFKYFEDILKSKIVITHQRLATSGLSIKYTQPFESEEFVLAHNGIINDFIGKKGSDSFGFFNQFLKEFNKSKGEREENIIKVIKKLLDGMNFGSYSIALLDKKTENLYYFKNYATSIHFYKNSEFFYMTTIEGNSLFLKMFKNDFKERKVEDFVIYRINADKTINIKKVGKITKEEKKKKIKQIKFPLGLNYGFPGIIQEEQETPQIDFYISTEARPCFYCGKLTHQMSRIDYTHICEECVEEDIKELKKDYARDYI